MVVPNLSPKLSKTHHLVGEGKVVVGSGKVKQMSTHSQYPKLPKWQCMVVVVRGKIKCKWGKMGKGEGGGGNPNRNELSPLSNCPNPPTTNHRMNEGKREAVVCVGNGSGMVAKYSVWYREEGVNPAPAAGTHTPPVLSKLSITIQPPTTLRGIKCVCVGNAVRMVVKVG